MDKRSNRYLVILIYVVLALAAIMAYEPLRDNEFVSYDDGKYVTDNRHVKSGLTIDSITWALASKHASNWHPVTWLSHMLDCELFGTNPLGHHIVSLLFHTANTLLLFCVLKSTTGAVWQSVFVAAVFALHPLHVESVAWVAERKDVLSGFFWMLTLVAYARYAKQPGFGRYIPVILHFSLGLMTKPMLITLPFVLLLLDYWPLGRLKQTKTSPQPKSAASVQRLVWEKVPLFILTAASCVVTYLAQQAGGTMAGTANLPLRFRLINAGVSYVAYIAKMIWPRHLAVFYPLLRSNLPVWKGIAAVFVLILITWVVWRTRQKPLIVGWLWYIVTLVPVIGLVQVGHQAMADRYTYLPSVGIFILAAWGCAAVFAGRRAGRIALAASVGIIPVVLLVCTNRQVRYWHNDLTLFGHTCAVTEKNFMMHNKYGVVLWQKGREAEAIEHFRKALKINPGYVDAHSNIGGAFLKQKKYDLAVKHLDQALRSKPDHANALNNLAMALKEQGKVDQGIEKWQKALELKPNHLNARYNIALAMVQQGRYDEAVGHFTEVLRIKPDYTDAHYQLAGAYYYQHKFTLAIEQLNVLADIYAVKGRFRQAVETAERALKLALSIEQEQTAQQIQERLRSYRADQAYIQPSSKKTSD